MLNVSCEIYHFPTSGVILADISRDRTDLNADLDVLIVRVSDLKSQNHTKCQLQLTFKTPKSSNRPLMEPESLMSILMELKHFLGVRAGLLKNSMMI